MNGKFREKIIGPYKDDKLYFSRFKFTVFIARRLDTHVWPATSTLRVLHKRGELIYCHLPGTILSSMLLLRMF